jgi:hypothetical protein
MECGDQVLHSHFIYEEQKKIKKNPTDVLAKHKAQIPEGSKDRPEFKAER